MSVMKRFGVFPCLFINRYSSGFCCLPFAPKLKSVIHQRNVILINTTAWETDFLPSDLEIQITLTTNGTMRASTTSHPHSLTSEGAKPICNKGKGSTETRRLQHRISQPDEPNSLSVYAVLGFKNSDGGHKWIYRLPDRFERWIGCPKCLIAVFKRCAAVAVRRDFDAHVWRG